MKYYIEKSITCTDSETCKDNIVSQIGTVLPAKIQPNDDTDQVEGHFSISHQQGLHKIWVFVYDNEGINESDSNQVVITKANSRCKKYTGARPTEQELSDAITG